MGHVSEQNNPSIRESCINGDAEQLLLLLSGDESITQQKLLSANALYLTAENGNLDCLKIVIQTEGLVNHPSYAKKTSGSPLHAAAYGGHLDCVLELIQAGAFLDAQDQEGGSALHDAAASESAAAPLCIQALASAGANVNLQDKEGRTPLYWASDSGHLESAISLVIHGANPFLCDKLGVTPEEQAIDTKLKSYLCSLREQALLQNEMESSRLVAQPVIRRI